MQTAAMHRHCRHIPFSGCIRAAQQNPSDIRVWFGQISNEQVRFLKIKQIKKQSAVCCAIIMIWGQFLCRWKRRKYCRKTTEEEKACSRQKIWHLNLQRHILVNGCYYHFEFESDSISESDLRRFREYEAATVRTYNAPVVTFVICSSKVKVLRDRIVDGINTYRVHLIRLKDEDADKVLDRIRENGAGCLSREDIIPLLFSPLMGGRSEQKDRILQGIRILKRGERIFPKEDYYFCGFSWQFLFLQYNYLR